MSAADPESDLRLSEVTSNTPESDLTKPHSASASEHEEDDQPTSTVLLNGTFEKNGMSKNQLKKIASRERYLEHRKRKRIEERERRKAKKLAIKEAGQGESLKRSKITLMADSSCKLRVAIDMSFDELMSEKDLRRTVIQLGWCYAANRRTENPLQYYVTSFTGLCKEQYDSVPSNQNQDIFFDERSIQEAFSIEEIVYLTADSDNVLETLDDSKVYVIGGIVDHNSQKGLCLEKAEKKGLAHARLPIDEFVAMKSRKVLTINHVFEILLKYTETRNWEKAFFEVIPHRKGVDKKEE